jgi:hypothetical protein
MTIKSSFGMEILGADKASNVYFAGNFVLKKGFIVFESNLTELAILVVHRVNVVIEQIFLRSECKSAITNLARKHDRDGSSKEAPRAASLFWSTKVQSLDSRRQAYSIFGVMSRGMRTHSLQEVM